MQFKMNLDIFSIYLLHYLFVVLLGVNALCYYLHYCSSYSYSFIFYLFYFYYIHIQTQGYIALVFEYSCGGELFTRLKERGKLKEAEAKFYFCEMALALQYLHETMKYVYRYYCYTTCPMKNHNIYYTLFIRIILAWYGMYYFIMSSEKTRHIYLTSKLNLLVTTGGIAVNKATSH
jgi:hypothetical protein